MIARLMVASGIGGGLTALALLLSVQGRAVPNRYLAFDVLANQLVEVKRNPYVELSAYCLLFALVLFVTVLVMPVE